MLFYQQPRRLEMRQLTPCCRAVFNGARRDGNCRVACSARPPGLYYGLTTPPGVTLLHAKPLTWVARPLHRRSSTLARSSKGNAGPCCSSVPLSGGGVSGAVSGVPFFHWEGLPVITPDDAALIAEYERLRQQMKELAQRSEQVDARLVELEMLLPDSYAYLGDPTDDLG